MVDVDDVNSSSANVAETWAIACDTIVFGQVLCKKFFCSPFIFSIMLEIEMVIISKHWQYSYYLNDHKIRHIVKKNQIDK